MSFQFRFEPIQRLRERDRDKSAAAVSEVLKAIEILDDSKRQIEDEMRELDSSRQTVLLGHVPVNELVDIQRYQVVLVGQLQHLEHQKSILNQEKERRQADLLKKQQSLKSLEKLRDHQMEQQTQMDAARQQSRLDEWSTTRIANQRNINT